MQLCATRPVLPVGVRRTQQHKLLRNVVVRGFEPDFSDKDGPGVASLLERDRKSVELKEDAFAAFVDEPAQPAASRIQEPAAAEAEEEAQPRSRGPASKRAGKLREEGGTPKRAREAIELGLENFQQKKYQEAIDLFQLSLELPGSGVMRLAGSPKEYSCASEGEENSALYNMACCWVALGQKQSAMTVLEALLNNNFDDYAAIRNDPDLAALRGPELEALLNRYDGLVAKLFGKKKEQQSSNKPWLQW